MTHDHSHLPFSGDDLVVIVDDESYSRFMAAELLDRLGRPRTVGARSGNEALAVLNGDDAKSIRLVLLDFNMPGLNGIEVLKQIRAGRLRVAHDVVVMMVTSFEAYGLVAAAMALDVDAFLRKPVSLADLRDHLDAIHGFERQISLPDIYWDTDVEGVGGNPRQNRSERIREGAVQLLISELTADQIIAEDIRGPDGTLLVSEGTQVTARLARLLRGLAAAGMPTSRVSVVTAY